MADDVVDQLADIHSVHGVGLTQSSSVMAVSLRSNSALAIASASMIPSVMCEAWHATRRGSAMTAIPSLTGVFPEAPGVLPPP